LENSWIRASFIAGSSEKMHRLIARSVIICISSVYVTPNLPYALLIYSVQNELNIRNNNNDKSVVANPGIHRSDMKCSDEFTHMRF